MQLDPKGDSEMQPYGYNQHQQPLSHYLPCLPKASLSMLLGKESSNPCNSPNFGAQLFG